jgi:DNA (cytosine-5)-methyltransferase 1
MSKPRLLDLFCGAGGAAMGYHRAGFEVVGVDIKPQPHYPFQFLQDDALDILQDDAPDLFGFDAIHASPPCQAFTANGSLPNHREHVDLLTPTRELLKTGGVPWVIENVPRAPMRPDVVLCGSMFGLPVWRHRWFEFSAPEFSMLTPCSHGFEPLDVTGTGGPGGRHRKPSSLKEAREALGIDWMSRRELSQAIPPAYTEWIGTRLMAALKVAV